MPGILNKPSKQHPPAVALDDANVVASACASATLPRDTPATSNTAQTNGNGQSALLRAFLSAFWLRPENALWMALRSASLQRTTFAGPSLDLCCGDGVFSFLHAGGRFDDGFDVFAAIAATGESFGSATDMYDQVGHAYQPAIAAPAHHKIDVGADWKPNLLTKAGRLGLYDELVVADVNHALPFDDDAFRTVYSNSAYWAADIDALLTELRRITAAGGTVLLQVKLDAMRECMLDALRPLLGDSSVDLLEGDRLASWPTLADRATWEARFRRAGYSIRRAHPFVTRIHAKLWNVGLRPIASMLVELANGVSAATRLRVKRRWVDLMMKLCAPLMRVPIDGVDADSEAVEITYELTPA